MAKVKNHTTRNVRHAKAVSMREMDKLAFEIVLKRDYGTCVLNNQECAGRLDPHHIEHRGNKSTRFLIENIITICRKHHSDLNRGTSERFFKDWFRAFHGDRWEKISAASRVLSKTGKAYIAQWHEYLQTERKKLG